LLDTQNRDALQDLTTGPRAPVLLDAAEPAAEPACWLDGCGRYWPEFEPEFGGEFWPELKLFEPELGGEFWPELKLFEPELGGEY